LKNNKIVFYEGVEYPSITALGRAFGIEYKTAYTRLKKGIPMHLPTLTPSECGRRSREVTSKKHSKAHLGKWDPHKFSKRKKLSHDQREMVIAMICRGEIEKCK